MSDAQSSKVENISRIALPIVCLIGAGFAAASLYNHIALMYGLNSGPSFCNISERINCDAVSASKYSTLFGYPLDGYGLAFYLSLFVLSLVSLKNKLVPRLAFYDAVLVLSLMASLLSVALFFISHFMVGALCVLCIGMHMTNFVLLILAAALNHGEKILPRIGKGVAGLVKLPHAVLKSPSRAPAWLLSILIIAIVLGVLNSPPFLAEFIAKRSPKHAQIEEVMKIALNDWRNQIPISMANNASDGLNKDYTRGPIFAPLQLVEFSDFECPACRNFYFALEELLKEYGDKVHFVFRNYPLDRACNPELDQDMHMSACLAAHFARCAGEQGKFWEAIDRLFQLEEIDAGQDKAKVDAAIMRISETLNLDGQAIQECLSSGRQMERIRQDLAEGSKLGLAGTPSLWLNGRKVKVPNPLILKRLFDEALKAPSGQTK